jgi:hypothetical protein
MAHLTRKRNRTVAKRPRYSRWRRLPGVYRFGEETRSDPSLEPQRLTLYLNWRQLDTAEALAAQAGGMTIQEYCTGLLAQAIEAERIRAHVASLEAQRGMLEGLHEIADDPEYLAEWSAEIQAQARERVEQIKLETLGGSLPDPVTVASASSPPGGGSAAPGAWAPEPAERVHDVADAVEAVRPLSPAGEVVLRHALQASDEGPSFLARLRRGESAAVSEVADLARALQELEKESRNAIMMDRRLVYALHRLAFEAQVLHTDAWPGVFDDWTVDTVRAAQEAVDRILSGQDIRYYSPRSQPEDQG